MTPFCPNFSNKQVKKEFETLEDMVVYKHDNKLWVRPISSFLSTEDITTRNDNVTGQKYRFERIG